MRCFLLLVLCALLGPLARPALADASTATVTGIVRDTSGNPVVGAFLTLPANQDILVHQFSDAEGRYAYQVVAGSPVGPIQASPGSNGPMYPGYSIKYVWGCVGILTASPGETLARDIVIAPHSSGMPYPGTAEQCAQPAAPVPGEQGTASAPRGWITGSVMAGGVPMAGVAIRLVGTPIATVTDATGHYQFAAISTADGQGGGPIYTVAVTPPPGYAVVGNASQAVAVQADHGVEADFTLQPVPCRFVLGFKVLHDAIPAVVGACADDELHNPENGDGLQHTTNGLVVWRKADNFTAFTDGYRTWVSGPNGVQERLNTQRFAWEANPDGLPVVP